MGVPAVECQSKVSKVHGFLPSDLQRRITATTSIWQLTTLSHSTLPAKHHCPTGFLCGWSVGVEFFARLLLRFCCWQRHIQTTFENVYVCFILAHTAHYRFYVYVLYKFALTLILTFNKRNFLQVPPTARAQLLLCWPCSVVPLSLIE